MRLELGGIVLLVCLAGPVAHASPVSVKGTVENGTTSATGPDGLNVHVDVVGTGGHHIDSADAPLARGRFTARVSAQPSDQIVTSTTYKGVTYSAVDAASSLDSTGVRLGVFEPTHDPSSISVLSDTTILSTNQSDALEALQLVRINNNSKKTFVGSRHDKSVYQLSIPASAYSVRIVEGITPGRTRSGEGAVAVGDPLQPGDISVSLAYKLPPTNGTWDVTRSLRLDTRRLDLLLDPDLSLSGDRMKLLGDIDFRGRPYRQFALSGLAAGDTLQLDVTGGEGTGVLPWAAGGGALLVLVVLVVAVARRTALARSRRRRLIEDIAQLDIEREAGALSERDYETKRAGLKKDLAHINRQT